MTSPYKDPTMSPTELADKTKKRIMTVIQDLLQERIDIHGKDIDAAGAVYGAGIAFRELCLAINANPWTLLDEIEESAMSPYRREDEVAKQS